MVATQIGTKPDLIQDYDIELDRFGLDASDLGLSNLTFQKGTSTEINANGNVVVLTDGFANAAAAAKAIADWAEGLRKRFNEGAIAICTGQKRGSLIYALCKYDFFVLHPVNPQTVAKYRRVFAPSRAKADPTDAHILVELLIKHPDKLQAWRPGSARLRSLQQLVEN